ncbi:related to TWF1-twinfilin, an actin monomer sequestering protein [Rhynchosporium agropyri]|uniref:Twinfilin n=1 Tax=Rhynchosporium agropyri TaxID=914238 RepID=A0A1E1KA27_9HELO|nr:related to TWF1-twinfilin, an actin monomer sequestering protein [Rhynchosporium agropyri]
MQSGISASQDLHTAFQTLVSSEDQRGLICTITKESLTPLTVLSPASDSFSDDLSLLAPHLDPKVALYIILRRYASSETAPFVAITYVPDSAPVRQKMLFASTRLTLVRELGIERFRETIFATTKEELTPQGFVKHDKHVGLAAPLTEEEQSLGEVKRKEAEEGRGMNERKSHVSSGVSMPISDEAVQALKGLASESGNNLVQLKINIPTETMELASSTSTDISALSATISATEPRYSFYRYTHTHNGSSSSPILFIYTCPSGSKIKERMLYAASSRSAVSLAEAEAGLKIDKKIEAGSPEDISEESINGDLHPKVEVKKAFERPKRPGRK